jgi:hypothetical protein
MSEANPKGEAQDGPSNLTAAVRFTRPLQRPEISEQYLKEEKMVARDRIELPTRGFSVGILKC